MPTENKVGNQPRLNSTCRQNSFTLGKYLLLAAMLFCAMGLATNAQAETATGTDMDNVCQNFLTQMVSKTGSWAGDAQPEVLDKGQFFAGDTLLGTYYNIAPEGYVLVPVLKEMQPVKAYSDKGYFDPSETDGPIQMLREVLASRLRAYASAYGSLDTPQPAQGMFDQSQKASWDRLAVAKKDFRINTALSTMAESPVLTTTTWDQGYPYNNLCPMGDGGRTLVGCVATAAAQIMAYWQWPPSGVGSHSFTWDGDNSCDGSTPAQELSADFSDTYDWANIVDNCDGGCNSAEQAALSELCYEVGVAYEMSYGACGSGANTSYGTTVYPTYFKYSTDCNRQNRTSHTLESWFQLGKDEIDAGRVANYRINLHAIVLDGWRDQGLGWYEFHLNYGWNDDHNTFYVLDNLYCGWVAGDVCPYDEEFMIVNIHPQTDPIMSCKGQTVDDPAGDGDGHADLGETVDLNVTVLNEGWDAANATGVLSTTDPYVTVLTNTASFDAMIGWGAEGTTQSPFTFEVDPSCPDPHIVVFTVDISADGGYSASDEINVFVGDTKGMTDDMESGEGFWTHSPIISTYVDEWHLTSYRQHSGSTSWKAGGPNSTNYSDLHDGALRTPPFLLPANAELSFWHWMDAEVEWDGGVVYISTDGGPWEAITPQGGYTHNIVDNPVSPFDPLTPAYSAAFDWTQAIFDLSAYSGVAQIMWRFGSDGAANEEGWYVDDVEVYSTGCCGIYTGGLTGNANCSEDGKVTLSDITRLIDRVYISKDELCCEENGNTNGSLDGNITLSDITRLIDQVYISKSPSEPCL